MPHQLSQPSSGIQIPIQSGPPELSFPVQPYKPCLHLQLPISITQQTFQNPLKSLSLCSLLHAEHPGLGLGPWCSLFPHPTLVDYAENSYATTIQAYSFAGSAILHHEIIGLCCAKMEKNSLATSTTNSEYCACCKSGKDIIWMQKLLDSLNPLL